MVSEAEAEYMELSGARKDASCKKVSVKGGVSKMRGCCDYFEPRKPSVDGFRCGNCEYVAGGKSHALFGEER